MQLEGKTTALSENKAGGDQPDQSNINVASAQTPGGVPSLEERFPVEFPDTMRKAVPGATCTLTRRWIH
jgi:hypothetical protein